MSRLRGRGRRSWLPLAIFAMGISGAASSCQRSVEGSGGSTSSATSTGTPSSTGSGKDTAACKEFVAALCMKAAHCAPGSTPQSEQECETMYGTSCPGTFGCPLDGAKVDTCTSDLGTVACMGNNFTPPPSCEIPSLCQVGGQPYCLEGSISISDGAGGGGGDGAGGSCALHLDACSDGNSYAVTCNGTCTCTTNGSSPKVVADADYCGSSGRKLAVAACGWDLYAP